MRVLFYLDGENEHQAEMELESEAINALLNSKILKIPTIQPDPLKQFRVTNSTFFLDESLLGCTLAVELETVLTPKSDFFIA